MKRRFSIIPALAAAATITALMPSSAQAWVQAGRLDCRSAGGVTFVVGAVVQFRCMFYPVYGGRPIAITRRSSGSASTSATTPAWDSAGRCSLPRPISARAILPGAMAASRPMRAWVSGPAPMRWWRLHQHVRAAAVQRTGPGRRQCFRRHRRADARPGAPLTQSTRFATESVRSPGHAGAFARLFVPSSAPSDPRRVELVFRSARCRRRGQVPRVAYPSKCALANAPIRLKR